MFKLTNNIFLLLVFFKVFFSFGQLNSFEFKNPLPPDGQEVLAIDEKYFGSYEQIGEKVDYIIEADGIYAASILYLSISKETIRESSKYDVRDNYLFGVKENDSIPCVLEDDTYYYGLKDKIKIAGAGTDNKIIRMSGSQYCINYFDNGTYIPSLLTFKGMELVLAHFDYENDTQLFEHIAAKGHVNHRVILDPTLEEWQVMDASKLFPSQRRFVKRVD